MSKGGVRVPPAENSRDGGNAEKYPRRAGVWQFLVSMSAAQQSPKKKHSATAYSASAGKYRPLSALQKMSEAPRCVWELGWFECSKAPPTKTQTENSSAGKFSAQRCRKNTQTAKMFGYF